MCQIQLSKKRIFLLEFDIFFQFLLVLKIARSPYCYYQIKNIPGENVKEMKICYIPEMNQDTTESQKDLVTLIHYFTLLIMMDFKLMLQRRNI